MKWTVNLLFAIQSLASLSILIFASIFFFIPEARQSGGLLFGIIFLVIFLKNWKSDTGLPALWKDRKKTLEMFEQYDMKIEVNNRYSLQHSNFIKKKLLIKRYMKRRGLEI
jgi:hypothetical protein